MGLEVFTSSSQQVHDGRVVVVKHLKIGGQGDQEFKDEIEIISHVHH